MYNNQVPSSTSITCQYIIKLVDIYKTGILIFTSQIINKTCPCNSETSNIWVKTSQYVSKTSQYVSKTCHYISKTCQYISKQVNIFINILIY